MHYTIVIEKGATSYGAHVPELPGCVAAAETREEVSTLIREAIRIYLEELKTGSQLTSSEMVGLPDTASAPNTAPAADTASRAHR